MLARPVFTFFRGTSDGIAGDGGRKGESLFLPLSAYSCPFAPLCAPFPAIPSLVLKKKGRKIW